MWVSIKLWSSVLESRPTCVALTWPSLKRINVGMPRTPNLGGVAGLLSTSNLTILILPTYFWAISSKSGAIDLHGPHHCAQKSTSTGVFESVTSFSNVLSLTEEIVLISTYLKILM